MSLLVSELDLTFDRIAVIAPTHEELTQLFEELTFDLSTDLGQNQKLDMALASVPQGPVRHWASFTMGKRGKLQSRIALVGLNLADAVANPQIFEIVDAVFFSLPLDQDSTDQIFRLKVNSRLAKTACFVALKGGNGELRQLALVEWFRRSFKRPQFLQNSAAFLREGLEWVLSF